MTEELRDPTTWPLDEEGNFQSIRPVPSRSAEKVLGALSEVISIAKRLHDAETARDDMADALAEANRDRQKLFERIDALSERVVDADLLLLRLVNDEARVRDALIYVGRFSDDYANRLRGIHTKVRKTDAPF